MPSNTVKFTPEKPAKEKRTHGLGITVFSAIVLVIIVVTFIGAPVVSKVTEQPGVTFGSYDGLPIDFIQGNAFSQQVEALNRFYEQYNQGNTNIDLQRQMVWRQAFEQTALQIGLQREAELAGIVVTQAQVDKAQVTHPAYQKDGKFSEELWRTASATDKFKYSQETRRNLLIQQYTQDRTDAPLVSEATKNFIAAMAYPQRKFSFVTFTDADYPAALVGDYAVKNKGLFRTLDLSRITITSSEGDAQKVHDEAVKGDKAFADLAKTYSKDALADSGGALSVRHYYELKQEVPKTEDLDKLFTLPKGAISSVIRNDKVWVIYKINAPATDADTANQDVLAVVRSYIARNERGLLEDNLEAQAKAFAATAGKDFNAAAKALKKTPQQTGWVPLNFGNHDLFGSLSDASQDSVFQGLASNEDFFKKAFRLQAGEISAPVLASPAVLVLKVDEIKTAPQGTDKPVSLNAIAYSVSTERIKDLNKLILGGPKFKDQFQSEFNRLFQQK